MRLWPVSTKLTRSVIPPDLGRQEIPACNQGRRAFLGYSVFTGACSFIPPALLAFADDKNIGKLNFNSQFKELISIYETNHSTFDQKLNEFVSSTTSNYDVFVSWYKDSVSQSEVVNALKADDYVTGQIILEEIGRKIIPESNSKVTGSNMAEKAINLSQLLPSYIQLIGKNNSQRDFIANALRTCDGLIFSDVKDIKDSEMQTKTEYGEGSVKIADQLLTLYETALQGIRKLPLEKIDGELKTLIFEIPWDCEVFGNKNDSSQLANTSGNTSKEPDASAPLGSTAVPADDVNIKKYHDRVIQILSDNFFGLQGLYPDIDGFSRMIGRISGNVDFNNPTSGWPPYIVYSLIDKNPEYFRSAVNLCAQEIRKVLVNPSDAVNNTTLNPSNDKTKGVDLFEEGMKFFKFLSTLNKVKQSFYYPKQLPHHYPKVPQEIKDRVEKRVHDELTKPITDAFLDNVKAQTVNVRYDQRGERHVEYGNWRQINEQLIHIANFNSDFGSALGESIAQRLKSENNSYAREMCYQTLSVAGCRSSAQYESLKQALMNEESLQAVRGLGFTCAKRLHQSGGKINADKFAELIEKVSQEQYLWTGLKKLEEVPEEDFSLAQKLFVKALRIFTGDTKLALSDEMLNRKFDPPTVVRTFKVRGKTVVVRIPYGDREAEQRASDIEYKEGGEEVKYESEYSQENIECGKVLRRLWHNAFLLLTYTTAQYECCGSNSYSPSSPNMKIKNAMTAILEQRFRYNLMYQDSPSCPNNRDEKFGVVNWGEKIGALIELYESFHGMANESEKFVLAKLDDLGNALFKEDGLYKGAFGGGRSLFADMKDSLEDHLIREIGKKIGKPTGGMNIRSDEYRKTVADIKASSAYKKAYDEETRKLIIMKMVMAEGILRAPGNRQLLKYKTYLIKNMPGAGYDEYELKDPYKYLASIYGWGKV